MTIEIRMRDEELNNLIKWLNCREVRVSSYVSDSRINHPVLRNAGVIDNIIKAIKIHNDKYNYDKVNYINCRKRVIITCKIHGDFLQRPYGHLVGYGCPECGKISQRNKVSLNIDIVIAKAKKIHGDKYDYSEAIYINRLTKIIIICKIHGEFEQQPHNHLK